MSARIRFENRLLTSSSLAGAGSPLITGASGRLWATNDGRLRLELQSPSGDAQILSEGTTLDVYDASSKTDYRMALPKDAAAPADHAGTTGNPTVATVQAALDRIGAHATLSAATPTVIAGHGAYSVRAAPKDTGGLVGAVELAFDAARGSR